MKDEDFDRLLKITRIRLSQVERARIKKDVEEIIGYFDNINKFLLVTDVETPAYQPIEVPTKFREDRIIPFDNVEDLKKASKLEKGYILGPKL